VDTHLWYLWDGWWIVDTHPWYLWDVWGIVDAHPWYLWDGWGIVDTHLWYLWDGWWIVDTHPWYLWDGWVPIRIMTKQYEWDLPCLSVEELLSSEILLFHLFLSYTFLSVTCGWNSKVLIIQDGLLLCYFQCCGSVSFFRIRIRGSVIPTYEFGSEDS
jgi:hypothetical protein